MRKFKNIFYLFTFFILITGCSTTVQRRIMVTDNMSSIICNEYTCGNPLDKKWNKDSLKKECMKFSYDKSDVDRLLENGAKIISTLSTKKVVDFKFKPFFDDKYSRTLSGECIGIEYVIEGYQTDFEKILQKNF